MSNYYPVHLDITGKQCLVVGGGQVAERKVMGLLDAGAKVRVVSLTLTPLLQTLADTQQIDVLIAPYDTVHLIDACLVFAATDHRDMNARVAADAKMHHLFVNVVDAPSEGNLLVPSIVRRGDLCLSISTGGNSPLLAARLREKLESHFGQEYGALVELLGEMRSYIKQATTDPQLRRNALTCLLDAEADLRTLLLEDKREEARTKAITLIRKALE